MSTFLIPAARPGGSPGQMQWNSGGAFAGAAFSAVATSGDLLTLTAQAITDIPLVVKGKASQSANLFQCRTSSATGISVKADALTLTCPLTELVMEQTGDQFGTTRLHLQNRSGQNGPLFENTGLDLVDFGFQPSTGSSAKRSLRLENRAGNTVIALPEFQIQGFNGASIPVATFSTGALTIGQTARGTSATSSLYLMNLPSTGTTLFSQAELRSKWTVDTTASRTGQGSLWAYDTAARECLRFEASGTAAMIGFLGATASTRATITGSRGGNAALAALLTELATKGLITDGTSA